MREYFTLLFLTVCVVCVLSLISYKGRGESAVKSAFAVIVLYCALVPLGDYSLPDTEFFGGSFDVGDFNEDYIKVCEDAFSAGVKNLVCSEFSLDEGDVYVRVLGFDFETVSCSEIRVVLSGRAALADRYQIEKFVTKSGLGGCAVEVRIG